MRQKVMAAMRFFVWFVPAAFVFAAGFALAARYDLALNIFLFRPKNAFAVFMEAFGWQVLFLPSLFACALVVARPRYESLQRVQTLCLKIGAVGVLLLGYAALFYKTYGYLTKRGWLALGVNWQTALFLTLAVEAVFATVLLAFLLRDSVRVKLMFWGAFATVYMAVVELVVNVLKVLWQRTRFDDMVQLNLRESDLFTAWSTVPGNGGSSFPSGHTACAAGLLLLLILPDLFASLEKHRTKLYWLCWLYIAAMAFSRVLIGRHYLSDTLAAAAIAALSFLLLHRLPLYRKTLKKTLWVSHLAQLGEMDDL